MASAIRTFLVVGLVSGMGVTVGMAQVCPCDGDVNGDGVVNIHDAICIAAVYPVDSRHWTAQDALLPGMADRPAVDIF